MLGPGTLVLIVGPSGAGKDTLIAYARRRLQAEARFHFSRRIITRKAEPGLEDSASVSEPEFRDMLARGRFALHWRAHGLSYGIPAEIDRFIAAGDVVVINVSRDVVAPARGSYENVLAVRIVAPPAILAQRLSRRGRESPAEIEHRLARYRLDVDLGESIEIVNDGHMEQAGDALTAVLANARPPENTSARGGRPTER